MHAHALRTDYLLLPTKGPKGGSPGSLPFGNIPAEMEDLSYRIELWSTDKTSVEALLAVTSSAAIGFAPPLDRAFQRIERRGQPARRDFDLARPGGGIGSGKSIGGAVDHAKRPVVLRVANGNFRRPGRLRKTAIRQALRV